MDAAEDLCGADAPGEAAPTVVDEVGDIASVGAGGGEDGGLGAGVDEGFNGDVVHEDVDVEHGDAAHYYAERGLVLFLVLGGFAEEVLVCR